MLEEISRNEYKKNFIVGLTRFELNLLHEKPMTHLLDQPATHVLVYNGQLYHQIFDKA